MTYYDFEKEHGDIWDVEYIYEHHGPATHTKITFDDGYEYVMTIDEFKKDLDEILMNTSDEDIQKEVDKYIARYHDAPDRCPWDLGMIAEYFWQDGCWQTAISNYVSTCWDCYEEEEEEETL